MKRCASTTAPTGGAICDHQISAIAELTACRCALSALACTCQRCSANFLSTQRRSARAPHTRRAIDAEAEQTSRQDASALASNAFVGARV